MTLREELTRLFSRYPEHLIGEAADEVVRIVLDIKKKASATGWLEARGSRPPGLRDTDIFEFVRAGRPLGRFAAGEFNWDLWVHYRPCPT